MPGLAATAALSPRSISSDALTNSGSYSCNSAAGRAPVHFQDSAGTSAERFSGAFIGQQPSHSRGERLNLCATAGHFYPGQGAGLSEIIGYLPEIVGVWTNYNRFGKQGGLDDVVAAGRNQAPSDEYDGGESIYAGELSN